MATVCHMQIHSSYLDGFKHTEIKYESMLEASNDTGIIPV